ncbi:MAG TPA: glycosyltransferase family 4 protein [Thermoanaerobaculia bacterium]|nr:glycosyltransferase family 4 protein [Thermoanaerobaculia bacterium]
MTAPALLDVGIVVSTLGLLRGGVESMAAHLALGLAGRGHRVTLVGGRWPGRMLPEDLAALPVTWLRVPCAPANLWSAFLGKGDRRRQLGVHPGSFRWGAALHPGLRRLVASADVTFTLLPADTALLSAWRRRRGLPHVSYYLGGGRRWLERDLSTVRLANPSAAAKSKHLAEYPVDGPLVPGIPADLLAAPYEVRERAERLLFVGRLEIHKGALAAFEVFRRVAGELPDIHLLYLGDGAARGALLREIRQSGLERRVILAGAVPPEQVFVEMRRADLLLFPSRNENLPLTLLEAQAVGLPLLASDVAGIREAVHEDGILLPPEDAEAWAGSLREIVADPERRESLSLGGRTWARDFTWERSVEALEGYLRLAAGRTARLPR